MRIALLYALFAAIATAVNLGVQLVVVTAWPADDPVTTWPGFIEFALALVAGTLIGQAVKYVLDKRWIFAFQSTGPRQDARLFVLYTLMSVVTTVVFWGFEFGFDLLTPGDADRYAGAVVGLAIGYAIKYRLDKRFVFRAAPQEAAS